MDIQLIINIAFGIALWDLLSELVDIVATVVYRKYFKRYD